MIKNVALSNTSLYIYMLILFIKFIPNLTLIFNHLSSSGTRMVSWVTKANPSANMRTFRSFPTGSTKNDTFNLVLAILVNWNLSQDILTRIARCPCQNTLEGRLQFTWVYPKRNLFGILFNQTQIRLYLPFSDWFGSNQNLGSEKLISIFFQIECNMIVATVFLSILNQMEFCLVPNQSLNGKCNLILV